MVRAGSGGGEECGELGWAGLRGCEECGLGVSLVGVVECRVV